MPRIVHFGIGNFHRAHQAWYTEQANRLGGEKWNITGVSLRSPDIRDRLCPQNGAYTLVIRDEGATRYERIEAIDAILFAPDEPEQVVEAIAGPDTSIISLTVTEKGYHLDQMTGALDLSRNSVVQDIQGGTNTIYGLMARGLEARAARDAGPLTILCCDNLSGNGRVLNAAFLDFVQASNPTMLDYAESMVTFPNTMVDRITPATTDALRAEVAGATGWSDTAPVATEAFTEWVVENTFISSRPRWDAVSTQFVADVAPYETRKLRLLNGAHSYLAYAGILAGYEFVNQAIADPALREGATGIMIEAAETLTREVRASSGVYSGALVTRFANPTLRHRLRQIAMDGSQKVPIRLVESWVQRRKARRSSPHIEAAIGAWLAFLWVETRAGQTLQDPMADELAGLCRQGSKSADVAQKILTIIGAPAELGSSAQVLQSFDAAKS